MIPDPRQCIKLAKVKAKKDIERRKRGKLDDLLRHHNVLTALDIDIPDSLTNSISRVYENEY